MEIDLYRDDGIVHVITTGVSYVDKVLWISTYFGCCRYDGRHWRGYFDQDCGLPSDFTNNVKARSAQEAWFCTDKGLGACMDAETDTWVTYTSDGNNHSGKAVIKRENESPQGRGHRLQRAAQLPDLRGLRRQRRLGRHLQGPGPRHRRRLLSARSAPAPTAHRDRPEQPT